MSQPKPTTEQQKVTFGAFLDGRLVSSITVEATPRQMESAIRTLRNSYPEGQVYRKI